MKAQNTQHTSYTLRYEIFVLGESQGFQEKIFTSHEEASQQVEYLASIDIGDLVIGNFTINGKPYEW
jgi:hypothetical protein